MSHASCRHGLSSTPSLTPRMPASSNSRWSELPVPSSRCQSSATPTSSAAASSSRSTRRRGARRRRAQAERRAAADLVERERVAQPPARHDLAQRQRAEVVRRAGVDPLLGAGGDEPDRARRVERARAAAPAPASSPRPDALSSAPGDGGTVSACAISTRTQRSLAVAARRSRCASARAASRTAARAPPARRRSNRRRSRVCARRSSRPAAGRAPSRAIETATLWACVAQRRGDERGDQQAQKAPRRLKHRRHGLEQDREVEPDRPALEVEEVEPHEVVEVELRAAGHLPQAGDRRAARGSASCASPRAGRSRAAAAAAGRRATSGRRAR